MPIQIGAGPLLRRSYHHGPLGLNQQREVDKKGESEEEGEEEEEDEGRREETENNGEDLYSSTFATNGQRDKFASPYCPMARRKKHNDGTRFGLQGRLLRDYL